MLKRLQTLSHTQDPFLFGPRGTQHHHSHLAGLTPVSRLKDNKDEPFHA